ncbi:hypothetical protein CF327_g2175 [Tilletia walkeri]|uniref:Uncharacterized protein n=1 Tax=Tilletia walkeri TaxID=117179 RepID=A0A8X7NHE3_9BASI|nr:hypothetical protein CF327_g2175 [Tilletia walkeri]KAE8271941.1 hypothetical protein A4X09_0g380 [Tilletia walkeri]
MSASIFPSASFSDAFTAADDFMKDLDRDDSASFLDDNPDYRPYSEHKGIVGEWVPQTTPPAILNLFSQLVRAEKTSSNAILKGTKVGLDILRLSEETPLLRREGRWFVHRALDFLNLVAADKKASGHRLAAPGSLRDICIRSIVERMEEFKSLVANHHKYSTVMRSQFRKEHKTEATERIWEQRGAIRECKNKFGFASKICRIASSPNCPSTAPAVTLRSIKTLYDENVSFGETLMRLQSDARLAAFPPLETLLDLANFFQAIESAENEVREDRSCKRLRESSPDGQDSHDASLEMNPGSQPEIPVLNVQSDFPKSLLRSLAPDRMTFESMDQLDESKNNHLQLLASMFWEWPMDDETLTGKDGFVYLQCQCTAFAQVLLFEEAAFFGELMVLMCREDEERVPSVKNKIKLAAALGALSVLLEPTCSSLQATQAAEEGIKIVQELLKTEPSRYVELMAALKTANAKALLQSGAGLMDQEEKIRMLQKAYRIAEEALMLSYKHLNEQATDTNLLQSLARALHVKAVAGKNVVNWLLHHQIRKQYPSFPLLPASHLKEANLSPSPFETSKHLKRLIKKINVEVIDALVTVSERSIQLYRELIKQVPNLYEPLLGEALILKAQILSFYSPQAGDTFREAATFYDMLSAKFPHQFDDPATRAYAGLAKRQRWANDLEGAADSYQKALDHLLEPLGPTEHRTTAQHRQWDRVHELKIDRPMICVQLERYEDGLADSERVKAFLGGRDGKIYSSMMEEMALEGCFYWLLGRLEEAKEVLKSSLQPIIEDEERMRSMGSRSSYSFWDEHRGHILTLGWQGAVKSAMGDHIHALKDGKQAVKGLRKGRSKAETRYSEHFKLDPFHRIMLPHFLVLLAGTLLALGNNEDAMEHVQESLELNSDSKADPSTVKTALMLKARLLEETNNRGNFMKAAKIRAEADAIPFRGFLHRMGCSIGRVQRRHSWST